jgi:hypothetical protein
LDIFEQRISDIAAILDAKGALLHMDGANTNALAGVARPGDFLRRIHRGFSSSACDCLGFRGLQALARLVRAIFWAM